MKLFELRDLGNYGGDHESRLTPSEETLTVIRMRPGVCFVELITGDGTRTHDLRIRQPTMQQNALKIKAEIPIQQPLAPPCIHDNRKIDRELAEIDDAWIDLPKAIQQATLAMVRSARKGGGE
jgi:hypothetical protein